MSVSFFPGSFNPFTVGHADIVERALEFSEKIIIGVGFNVNKPENSVSAESRATRIRQIYSANRRVEVVTYTGLTVEAVRRFGADVIIRGVRNTEDFIFEYNQAAVNKNISGIQTLFIPTDPSLSFVSSSMIRELIENGAEEEALKYLPKP